MSRAVVASCYICGAAEARFILHTLDTPRQPATYRYRADHIAEYRAACRQGHPDPDHGPTPRWRPRRRALLPRNGPWPWTVHVEYCENYEGHRNVGGTWVCDACLGENALSE